MTQGETTDNSLAQKAQHPLFVRHAGVYVLDIFCNVNEKRMVAFVWLSRV